MARIREIVARYPEATFEEINYSAPSVCDPNHEMVGIPDEHVEIEKFLHVVRMHVLSSFDDLSR